MALTEVLVTALAAHYLTYVLTRSDFPPVRWARGAVVDSFGAGSPVAYLVTCGYCTAFYVAGFVTLALDRVEHVPAPVLVWLASASVAGTLVEIVDTIRSVTLKNAATTRTLDG